MSESLKVVKDVTCTFCGCLCDDITVTVDLENKRITKAENACVLGRVWFKEHGLEQRPFALIGGYTGSSSGRSR